jgi:hypothetical protein
VRAPAATTSRTAPPLATSPCIDDGAALNPAVLPAHNVVREYVKHQSSVARAVHGPIDIGAYEF